LLWTKQYGTEDYVLKIHKIKVTDQLQMVGLQPQPLTFFTSRLGGAGGIWLVSMNRLVFRLSGAEHKTQHM